jgi:2-methylcitrate dehydratase PrpD
MIAQESTPRSAMLTEQLASFVADFREASIDADTLHFAKRHLIDTVGAMLIGSRQESLDRVEAAMKLVREDGRFPVPGRARRADYLDAIFLSATAGHSGEVDDGYRQGSIHPGVVVVPAALLTAYRQKASGLDLLVAVTLGYEAIAAISRRAHPALRRKGFHPTSAIGPFGAAIATARLLSLPAGAVRCALGFAGSAASGLFAFANGGADVKRLHPGHAAREGAFSVLLAQEGLNAPLSVLESQDGFFQAFTGSSALTAQPFALPPQVPFAISDCYLKPYACCRHLQPAVDALLEILHVHALAPQEIEAIEIETYSIAAAHARVPWAEQAEAQLSFPYVIATAARHRRVTLDDFQPRALSDSETGDLCGRISVSASERMDQRYPASRPAMVTIRARGQIFQGEAREAKGDPTMPLDDTALGEKFFDLAAPVLGAEHAKHLLEQFWKIEALPNVAPLVDTLARS